MICPHNKRTGAGIIETKPIKYLNMRCDRCGVYEHIPLDQDNKTIDDDGWLYWASEINKGNYLTMIGKDENE